MTDAPWPPCLRFGAIDQFVESTDVLSFRPTLCRPIGWVYELATGAG